MKNSAKWTPELQKIAYEAWGLFGLFKNRPEPCTAHTCEACAFSDSLRSTTCASKRLLWLLADVIPDEPDWEEIEIDTPVLCSDNESFMPAVRRYFAGVKHDAKFAWDNGCTSWTTDKKRAWNYMRIEEAPKCRE